MGPSTENMIPKVPNLSPKFLRNHNQIKFVIAHVSNEEVLDIISSLENKSTGPSNSLNDLERTVNKDLNKLYLWLNLNWLSLNLNWLSLNIDKTNFIIFHPYNKPVKQQVTIKINNTAINEKEYIKYLGVLVDSSLIWKHHISTLAKKISRAIGIMYTLRPFLPLNVMKNVYYSLIYSQIIYAIEVWGSAVKSEMTKILILQKRVMRLMTFNVVFPSFPGPLSPTDPIFVTLCCMKVEDIHKFQVAKFVF